MIYLKLQGPWVVDNLKAISFISIFLRERHEIYLGICHMMAAYVLSLFLYNFTLIAFKHTSNLR